MSGNPKPTPDPQKTPTPTNPDAPPTGGWRETHRKSLAEIQEHKRLYADGRKSTGNLAIPAVSTVGVSSVESAQELRKANNESAGMPPKNVGSPSRTNQPGPSGNVECPHCGRKFEPVAAEKHIPNCEKYEFNKGEKDKHRKSLTPQQPLPKPKQSK